MVAVQNLMAKPKREFVFLPSMLETEQIVNTIVKEADTPLMKQYYHFKGKYPDAILLFRVGDFYETFGKDAIVASKILGIVLTRRKNGSNIDTELAGFPYHSLDTYLPKLVRSGQRVAICEQLEDARFTKTIVKRGVTEIVTPGVSYSDKVLDHRSNNFLAAIHIVKDFAGVAFLDVSTGEFYVAEGTYAYVEKLLQSFKPTEVLFQKQKENVYKENFGDKFYNYRLEDWAFTHDFAKEKLQQHFGTITLKGFGIEQLSHGIIAAGVALHYLSETQNDKKNHITSISRIEEEKYIWLDQFTIRNLELITPSNLNGVALIDVLDHAISPMGARMLKRWLLLPLRDRNAIETRLEIVEFFIKNEFQNIQLALLINQIGDLERIISKLSVGKINPREVLQLKKALDAIGPIKEMCTNAENTELSIQAQKLNDCQIIRTKISNELFPDCPVVIGKGQIINKGVNQELDELREISTTGKDYLLKLQQKEIERTGISSLKIAYNNVFGYYLEVRNTHKEKVPSDWIRKQTLVSSERYITPELKEYETKILGAEEKIGVLEFEIFNQLIASISEFISPIQLNAQVVGQLDCLLCFANLAQQNSYCKPEINDSMVIDIENGRHPVIEHQLPLGESYVANNLLLDNDSQQIIMLTGPNMSGKSALLRQTALIVIMAQMGCYVPASKASIGIIDKIFTRVGASDNISAGESTFMVEMTETASILNNLSERSLIILDEIGRGTSTYDGISIAWAIAEYLHENKFKSKTLFATHYHELNNMADVFLRIKNYSIAVKEINKKIIFLRKLIAGGSEHSFGIHVAQMAGMPKSVVERAEILLKKLEKTHGSDQLNNNVKNIVKADKMQLSFFEITDPVIQQIQDKLGNIDINTLTPIEALMKLNEIKIIMEG
jgi:DNA mismatch repair protein MutS